MRRLPVHVRNLLAILLAPAALVADSTVVFNEIMYHARGNVPDLEWVELHNQMAVDMDLSGWYLDGGIYFEFEEGAVVPGGGFIVVAASPAALEAQTGFAEALGPFSGRIDNSGEALELRNNSARLMDRVSYRSSGEWPEEPGGSGATLAKRHPDLGSAPAASWTASEKIGGTPGAHNFPLPPVPGALPQDVISYWGLDESSGRVLDRQGGNHGTVGTAAARVAGIVGAGAIDFANSATAYISVGTGAGNNFSVTKGIALEALIQPGWSGAEGDQDMLFRKEDPARRILLGFQNDGQNAAAIPPVGPGPVLSFGLNAGGVYEELDMPLDGMDGRPTLEGLKDGMPHHVAATYDSATGLKAIFVDGVLAFSTVRAPAGPVSSGGTAAAYIGNTTGRAEPFTGTIDEVAIWKRALGAEEIAAHVENVRAGRTYFENEPEPPPPPPPSVAISETFLPANPAQAWIELYNHGAESIFLQDHAIVSAAAGGPEFVFGPGEFLAEGRRKVLGAVGIGFEFADGDRLFLLTPDRKTVLAAAAIVAGERARFPDAGGPWLVPSALTPGGENAMPLAGAIVINEILYHPRGSFDGGRYVESSEAWIELFNGGAAPVDLTGWRIEGGIEFAFAAGTVLAAGEYLVVAADRDSVALAHPGIRVAGNFTGRLSRRSDRIRLVDALGNPADEVRYHDGGHWPEYADGGGSSLELRDPRADNSRPEAWAASEEASKASWKSYSYTAVAAAGVGPTRWNELVVGLLDGGECLIDDLSVVETPNTTPRELLQNGSFDSGAAAWRLLGNHRGSAAVADADPPGGMVLHLRASGPTEHMHNHAETTFAGGARVTNGREYKVSFDAKWVAGSNALQTRLYFNRAPRTTLLEVPASAGTPGARNSRWEPNIGPTFEDLRHEPAVPKATEAVTVTAIAGDPDGVAFAVLHHAVNGGPWIHTTMEALPGGAWRAMIPPQPAAAIVQFYAEAADGLKARGTAPPGGAASRALYKVEDGQAVLGRIHNVRIVMTLADTNLLHTETNVMSNERLGATLVYDEKEVFYDVGVRLKGSERGRPVAERVGFNIRMQPERRFRGVHESIQIDRSGGWKFGRQFGQDEIVIKHIVNRAGGIPGMYDDICRVIAPRNAHTSSALLIMAGYGNEFLDTQFEDGGDGTSYEYELIYSPSTTANGSPEGLKRPQPDDVLGTDLRDLGNDREAYRWTFLIENNRTRDDYAPLMALCKAFGAAQGGLQAATDAAIDADQWMRSLSIYSLCGVGDAYSWGNNHNLIFHARASDGKVLAFPWDMDFAFTQATNAPLIGDQNLSRVINLPPNRRLYFGHMLDIMSSSFDRSYMSRWLAHYGSLCGQDFSSIASNLDGRRAFVLQTIGARIPFAIVTNGGQDFTVDGRTATIDGNAWYDVREIFLEGSPEPLSLRWTSASRWQATVELASGPNLLRFGAFGMAGEALAEAQVTVTSLADPLPFLRGDADLSGDRNITDAVVVLEHLFLGGAIRCADAADSDDSEVLDLTDPIYLLDHLFRGGAAPPAPYDTPGTEPATEGPLQCEEGLAIP